MKKYLPMTLRVLLVILFLGPAAMKLTGNEMIVQSFENFGYAMWFMYFIGVVELLGALGIAFGGRINAHLPVLATTGLMVIMIGAVGSHLVAGDPISATVAPAVYFILLGLHLRNLRKPNVPVL